MQVRLAWPVEDAAEPYDAFQGHKERETCMRLRRVVLSFGDARALVAPSEHMQWGLLTAGFPNVMKSYRPKVSPETCVHCCAPSLASCHASCCMPLSVSFDPLTSGPTAVQDLSILYRNLKKQEANGGFSRHTPVISSLEDARLKNNQLLVSSRVYVCVCGRCVVPCCSRCMRAVPLHCEVRNCDWPASLLTPIQHVGLRQCRFHPLSGRGRCPLCSEPMSACVCWCSPSWSDTNGCGRASSSLEPSQCLSMRTRKPPCSCCRTAA